MTPKMKAVFSVVPSERMGRPVYRRIGTAFVNPDNSLNVVLDALPLAGRLHIRDISLKQPYDPELAPDSSRPVG